MDTPTWVARVVVEAFHYMQLDEHGGSHGMRDVNALESALARPKNKHAYDDNVDLADLAASYAYAILKSHPFVDGNKRTAFVTAVTFLDLNGYNVGFTDKEVIDTMLNMASSMLSEEQLADWFRASMRRHPVTPRTDVPVNEDESAR